MNYITLSPIVERQRAEMERRSAANAKQTRVLNVHVDADDIKTGIPSHCEFCPVARAVRDEWDTEYNDVPIVTVLGSATQVVQMSGEVWIASTPEEAQGFMGKFDEREPVEPFSLTLNFEREK